MSAGLRLAVTTLTVLPIRSGPVNRETARVAMALAPLVGAGLGAVAGLLAWGLSSAGAPDLLAAAVVLAALALLTRGLHLDGLADTADGLGVHGDASRSLAAMRSPEVGAFGVAAVAFCLLVQAGALAGLVAERRWLAVGLGAAAGRIAITAACRRGVPAARPDGLGALVAATLPVAVPAGWTLCLAGCAVPADPGRPWQGPAAVLVALAASVGMVAHVTHRIGGVTGDVLGATCEITAAIAWAGLALG